MNAIAGKSVRADTRRTAACKYAFKAGYNKEIRVHEVELKENRKCRFNQKFNFLSLNEILTTFK